MPEQPTSSEGSKIRIGQGVPRSKAVAKEPEAKAEEFQEQLDAKGHAKWCDKCSILDQFIKHPRTCRRLPPRVEIFNLSDPGQLEKSNALIADAHPPGNPKLIMQQQEQAHNGTWSVMVRYQKIEYKVLLSLK